MAVPNFFLYFSSLLDDWSVWSFTLLCCITTAYWIIKNRKLPPGPFSLPLVGYAPFLGRDRAEHIRQLCRAYKTDVLSLRVYGHLMVVLDSYDLIKECFVKRADLVDRIEGGFLNFLDVDYVGIIGNSGTSWKEHRRFSVYMMRDFGMGKVAAEENIQKETAIVMEHFRSTGGAPFDPLNLVNMAVTNIISTIIYGRRYEYDNEAYIECLRNINQLVHIFRGPRLNFLLQYRIGKLILRNKMAEIRACFEGMSVFVRNIVQEHKQRYDGTVNDLIDAYLREIEKKTDDSTFHEKRLIPLIADMFLAGSETTTTTLRWAMLYMAAHPDVQQRVYEELDSVIGDRLPAMTDKKNTPYTEAVLCEIQRMNTLLPIGLFHTNLDSDFEISGYSIPKGSMVAANLHSVHRDPNIWKRPLSFDPENFLKDGNVINLDRLVVFSIGRRSCAGEALAKMELYIFFASWMKSFHIKPADDQTTPNLVGHHKAVFQPEPFEIRMIER